MGLNFPGKKDGRDDKILTPDDIRDVADSSDIAKAWEYMERTFKLSRVWKQEFEKFRLKQPRNINEVELFIRYCTNEQSFNEPLSVVIQKRDAVIRILRYIVKDKIEAKKKKDDVVKNYYRNGEWKKDVK